MNVIMKESERFKIHTNRELKDRAGKPMRFYSERDYRAELQRRGLERYDENKHGKRYVPKKYEGVSESAKHMMNSVTYDKRTGKPNIGDRYIKALQSMGVKNAPKEVLNKTRGGMYV